MTIYDGPVSLELSREIGSHQTGWTWDAVVCSSGDRTQGGNLACEFIDDESCLAHH
jgi:hypothetical protein